MCTRERRFFFVMSLLDVYDRESVHSHIGLSATAEDAVTMLWQALWKRKLLMSAIHKTVFQKPITGSSKRECTQKGKGYLMVSLAFFSPFLLPVAFM